MGALSADELNAELMKGYNSIQHEKKYDVDATITGKYIKTDKKSM